MRPATSCTMMNSYWYFTAAARLLRRWNLGALPVTDSAGRLRGVLTDRDIVLRCIALDNDVAETRVSEVMSRAVVTARPGDSVQSAAALMAREQLRRLPVAENGRLVGMVTACDLARHEEKLTETLTEAQKETFKKFKDATSALSGMTEVTAFTIGFKLFEFLIRHFLYIT